MKYSKLEQAILRLAYGTCLISVLGLLLCAAILLWLVPDFEEHGVFFIKLTLSFAVLVFGSSVTLGAIEFRGRTRS